MKVGTEGNDVLIEPNGIKITVILDGAPTEPISDRVTLAKDPQSLLIELAPSVGAQFDITGSYSTQCPNHKLTVSGETVVFHSESRLSTFEGIFQQTGGDLEIKSDNPVMATGGVIDIDAGTTVWSGGGTLGAEDTPVSFHIGPGQVVHFNGQDQQLYADFTEEGDIVVDGGVQTFSGNIANTGTTTVSSGAEIVVTKDSSGTLATTGESVLHLRPDRNAQHTGTIALSGTAPLDVDATDYIATIAGQITGTAPVDVRSGTLELGEQAVTDRHALRTLNPNSSVILNNTTRRDFGNDVLQGVGQVAVAGVGGLRLNAPQSLAGTLVINGAAVSVTTPQALKNLSSVALASGSQLLLSEAQRLGGVVSDPEVQDALLAIGSADLIVQPNQGSRYSGKMVSQGGRLVHRSSSTQILDGDLSELSYGLAVEDQGDLEIAGPIVLGPDSAYRVAADSSGRLRFTPGSIISLGGNITLTEGRIDLAGGLLKLADGIAGSRFFLQGDNSTAGLRVDGEDSPVWVAFGRQIVHDAVGGLIIDSASGRLLKQGFGDFHSCQALSTLHDQAGTSAIVVQEGSLTLSGPSLDGPSGVSAGKSDISVSGAAQLNCDLSGTHLFQRHIDGQGAVFFQAQQGSAVLHLGAGAVLEHQGNTTIGSGVALEFASPQALWHPGATSKILLEPVASLALQGRIVLSGGSFMPHLMEDASLSVSGPLSVELKPERTRATFGAFNEDLLIRENATLSFAPLVDQMMELKYCLHSEAASSTLNHSGAGRLLIAPGTLQDFSGTIAHQRSGVLELEQPTFASPHLSLGGDEATTIIAVRDKAVSTIGPQSVFHPSSGTLRKTRAGTLTLNAPSGLETWSGPLRVESGTLSCYQSHRESAHPTVVQRGARLIGYRSDQGASLGQVELQAGSELLITDQDFIESHKRAKTLSPVTLGGLVAHAGSEIVFALDPESGFSAIDPPQYFESAALHIEKVPQVRSPITVRLVPISSQPFQENTLFPLVKLPRAEAQKFAKNLKLFPSLKGESSEKFYAGGLTVVNDSPLLAQIYLGDDRQSDDQAYVVAQINAQSYAPSLRSNFIQDFRSSDIKSSGEAVTQRLFQPVSFDLELWGYSSEFGSLSQIAISPSLSLGAWRKSSVQQCFLEDERTQITQEQQKSAVFARHSQGAYHLEIVAQFTQLHAHSLQEQLIPLAPGVSQLWQFHEHESLLATQTQISASHALFQSEQWQGCLGARWRGNGYGVQHEKECFPEQYHLAWALSPCASLLFQSQATAAQLEVGCESWGAPQREALLLWWGRCHAKHVLGKNRAVEVFLGISAEQARAQIGYLTTF